MGFGGISIWQLLIILGIVVLLFGTKKLRNIGSDLGSAVKGFKKAMSEEEKKEEEPAKIEKSDASFKAEDAKPAAEANKPAAEKAEK